jgi:hypothetical protein
MGSVFLNYVNCSLCFLFPVLGLKIQVRNVMICTLFHIIRCIFSVVSFSTVIHFCRTLPKIPFLCVEIIKRTHSFNMLSLFSSVMFYKF